jgi:hypothetical protein
MAKPPRISAACDRSRTDASTDGISRAFPTCAGSTRSRRGRFGIIRRSLSYSSARGRDSRPKRVRLRPQCRGDSKGIDSGPGPPFGFITAAVDLAMVDTAKRNRKLVAHLAPERRILGKPKMVRVSRPAATDQARLFADEPDMSFVAHPARLEPRQGALIDCRPFRAGEWSTGPRVTEPRVTCHYGLGFGDLGCRGRQLAFLGNAVQDCHSRLECLFQQLSIGCCERVLHADDAVCPGGRLIGLL